MLTYNLMVDGDAWTASPASATQIDKLARSIEQYFETPRPPRWSHDSPREPPDRLVYLLDHQYSRRSLGWKRLKGADDARAAALRQVAERLDCEIFLALADVHETWSCEDAGWQYGDEEAERWNDEEGGNSATAFSCSGRSAVHHRLPALAAPTLLLRIVQQIASSVRSSTSFICVLGALITSNAPRS